MEHGREVKIGSSETIIITSTTSLNSIHVSKMKVNLSSPIPFVECSGELSTISMGLYGIKLNFNELGEFLYRIDLGENVEYIKIKVVEVTDNEIIKDLLQDINLKIEQYNNNDEQVFTDILRYLKIINARM